MVKLHSAIPSVQITVRHGSPSCDPTPITTLDERFCDDEWPPREWPPRGALPLLVSFIEADACEIAENAKIRISREFDNPDAINGAVEHQAAALLTGAFTIFNVQLRALAERPGRSRGRPREYARDAFLRACLSAYWRLTGRSPNYRTEAGYRTAEAPAVKFVHEVVKRGLDQLQRSPDPNAAALAFAVRHKLKNVSARRLANLIETEITESRAIMRRHYPSAPLPERHPPHAPHKKGRTRKNHCR